MQPAREGFLTHSLDGRIAESRSLRVDRIMEQVNAVVANNPMPTPRGCAPYAMDAANSENPSIVKAGMSGGLWNVPDVLLDWYASHAFIGPQACAFMAQQWLINKACTIPARDAVRNWFEITSAEGDEIDTAQIKRIERLNKKHLLKPALHEFVRMGRIFGVRVLLFKVDPGRMSEEEYYRNPFNLDAVKPGSYKGLVQIDPYWCGPMLDSVESAQPDDPHFYEPTWWIINGRPVHRTHLAIFRNAEVPDILKPAYLYGGVPVPQQIMERVYAAERTANEMPLLAMSKRLTVLKVDVDKFFANLDDSWNRILQWMGLRDNSGIKVCDRDSEDITQIDTTLTDLDDVVMTSYQLVAAAADVPVTKLLGTSPKGFNATGEYDEASYHETLESIQEHDLTPVVDRHHQLLCKSEGLDFDLAIEWNPLDAPTELEQAQTQKTKAETDQIYVNLGSIDQYDSRNRLIQDNRSGFTWLEAIERPEELDDLEPEPPPTGGTPQGEPSKGQEREGRQAQAMDVKDVNGQEHAPAGSSEGGQFTGEGGGGGQKG
ncbi:MAG: DUF1073 domain-containing protein, partial [Desulfobulbus sp.]|nr:DUF1073 domain-containing protein [Desulfobulbus sp.]